MGGGGARDFFQLDFLQNKNSLRAFGRNLSWAFVKGMLLSPFRPETIGGGGLFQGCIRSEAAPAAVRQVVGGGCQSGWGRLLSVTNATGDSGWA